MASSHQIRSRQVPPRAPGRRASLEDDDSDSNDQRPPTSREYSGSEPEAFIHDQPVEGTVIEDDVEIELLRVVPRAVVKVVDIEFGSNEKTVLVDINSRSRDRALMRLPAPTSNTARIYFTHDVLTLEELNLPDDIKDILRQRERIKIPYRDHSTGSITSSNTRPGSAGTGDSIQMEPRTASSPTSPSRPLAVPPISQPAEPATSHLPSTSATDALQTEPRTTSSPPSHPLTVPPTNPPPRPPTSDLLPAGAGLSQRTEPSLTSLPSRLPLVHLIDPPPAPPVSRPLPQYSPYNIRQNIEIVRALDTISSSVEQHLRSQRRSSSLRRSSSRHRSSSPGRLHSLNMLASQLGVRNPNPRTRPTWPIFPKSLRLRDTPRGVRNGPAYARLTEGPLNPRKIRMIWENGHDTGLNFCVSRYTHRSENHKDLYGGTVTSPKLRKSVNWTSFAPLANNSIIILCSTYSPPELDRSISNLDEKPTFGTSLETELRMQRILSPSALINFSNSTRKQFTQLFLLDLIDVNLYLSATTIHQLLKSVPSVSSHHDRRIGSVAAAHIARVEIFEEINHLTEDMLATFEYISSRIGNQQFSTASNYIDCDDNGLPERIQDLRMEITQCVTSADRLLKLAYSKYQLLKELREVTQSYRSYWLTTLAAIFLPLSLATSILSMQTRVAELHSLLFDFFGIAFMIGSFVIICGPAFRFLMLKWSSLKILLTSLVDRVLDEVARKDEAARRNKAARGFEAAGKDFKLQKAKARMRRLKYIAKSPLYILWALILASFLVGMSRDARLGLEVLGYELVAILSIGA